MNIRKGTRSKLYGLLGALLILGSTACSDSKKTSGTSAANAGEDQKVLVGDTVSLDGQASTGVSKATWSFVTKPDGSAAELSKSDWLTPTFSADVAGTYSLKLSLNGGEATDTIDVVAKKVIATISNGSDSTITTRTRFGAEEWVVNLQDASAKLSGSSSRGTISSYSWAQVSGPTAVVSDVASADLPFTAPGLADFQMKTDKYKWQPLPIALFDNNMVFRLTVTDAEGNTDTATATVNLADGGTEIARSSGLPNVGVGGPVYLSGPALKWGTASTAVTDWSWTLTAPSGSSAKFADSDSTTSTIQFPKFTPDIAGVYTVAYSSTSGAVTGVAPGSILINASTYTGVGNIGGATAMNPECATCHNGVAQSDKTTEWSNTKHASLFSNDYAALVGSGFNSQSLEYHTLGYNTSATDKGFDDFYTSSDVTSSSSTPATFEDFISKYSDMASRSGVQCESCHGPGAGHSGDPTKIAVSFSQTGACGQCHKQEAQWMGSLHNSTAPGDQTEWLEEPGCVRCHTSKGFATYVAGGHSALEPVEETGKFIGVTCAACHDPHDATNPAQLRVFGDVTLQSGATINAGKAAVCYTCHDGLYNANEADCDTNRDGIVDATDDSPADGVVDGVCLSFENSADFYTRQVHRNPQAAELEGVGAMTDLDKDGTADIVLNENSFHATSGFILSAVTGNKDLPSENNKCVTCHMATGPGIDQEGYNQMGEHTFAVKSGTLQNTSACTSCHLTLTTFNRTARADYDGDATIEGVQDEVKGLLLLVSDAIKAADATNVKASSGTKTVSGVITPATISFNTGGFNATSDLVRRSSWNHNLVVRGADFGIHNTAFVVKVLQGTYKKLTGSAVPGATIR